MKKAYLAILLIGALAAAGCVREAYQRYLSEGR
jgi:hypothetical protein